MDDHLHIIEHDPLAGGESVDRYRAGCVRGSDAFFDFARDRFQMRFGGSRADDEKVGETGDAFEIENDDVLRFLVRRVIGAGFG